MSFGIAGSRVFFVASFSALFALLAVAAPQARSQQTPIIPRMTASHRNAGNHFSLVDPSLPPLPSGGPPVGRFVSAISLGNLLSEGQAFPSTFEPDFLYGIVEGGTAIRRVSKSGAAMDTIDLSAYFSAVTGACLVKGSVPSSPQWIPGAYDLEDHYVVVGETNVSGYSTAMMLVNPATMAPYQIGLGDLFLMSSFEFQDVCFGAYPGPDGSYGTINDNEYRYVAMFSTGQASSGIYSLSLNKHETMNGEDPPPDFDPVQPTRGPHYTNVYPQMTSNTKMDTVQFPSALNSQLHCKAYYARPGLADFGAPTDVTYFIAGWVHLLDLPTVDYFGPVIQGYTLGQFDPLVAVTPVTGPNGLIGAPNNNFGVMSTSDEFFDTMTIVGDWLICGLGPEGAGVQAVYIPEFLDGPGDGDNGVRAPFSAPGGSARAGYHPNVNGYPVITYVGGAEGTGTMYAFTRNAFQNHAGQGLIENPTSINMHTNEEALLGINVRLAPQPFVGYWTAEDPADNFPGSQGGGGGGGGGGCGGSATGGSGTAPGLLALLGIGFLLNRVLREARPF